MERLPRAEGEAYVSPEVREFSPQARHEVPLGVAIETQQSLMNLMVPDRLRPYLGTSTGLAVGIEDVIFLRWHEKYARKFALLCDKLAREEENGGEGGDTFAHLVEGKLTSSDYEKMKEYLESDGTSFFNEIELESFIKENVH